MPMWHCITLLPICAGRQRRCHPPSRHPRPLTSYLGTLARIATYEALPFLLLGAVTVHVVRIPVNTHTETFQLFTAFAASMFLSHGPLATQLSDLLIAVPTAPVQKSLRCMEPNIRRSFRSLRNCSLVGQLAVLMPTFHLEDGHLLCLTG